MISLLHLNKLKVIAFFFTILIVHPIYAATSSSIDIWQKEDTSSEQKNQTGEDKKKSIESPILSDDINKITIKIEEEKIDSSEIAVIGIFDPQKNDFDLDMWSTSDGKDIKKILNRINKLKLSKFSEDLLFQVLFTNAYPPRENLTSKEFLKIKIDWLIKNRGFQDLEALLQINPEAIGKESKAIKFLVNEYLSSADIKSACEKANFIGKSIKNDYLDKFTIYCLIKDDRKDEAQLILDLLKEQGFKDKFFEDKIAFLLGFKDNTNQKISDDNLLNFYLSHITNPNFDYQPNEKTNKYIWRYLTSANLIETKDFEDENIILTYEKAAAENSLENQEIFNIYRQISFNINQLINATEVYKNLPGYKARALIYQRILLNDDVEQKLYLAFLLKDLFIKDKIFSVYSDELVNILKTIEREKIPDAYNELVSEALEKNFNKIKKIKFNNDILHRSKVLKHFIDANKKISRTEKDFKSVYKKIKRNKKYFISIMDIVVLESLAMDGIDLPKELDYSSLVSQLTIPQSLEDLMIKKQTGLVMLKIIEIIGEDKVQDLDPETIYFLSKILNELKLTKIRNHILSIALPIRT